MCVLLLPACSSKRAVQTDALVVHALDGVSVTEQVVQLITPRLQEDNATISQQPKQADTITAIIRTTSRKQERDTTKTTQIAAQIPAGSSDAWLIQHRPTLPLLEKVNIVLGLVLCLLCVGYLVRKL